MRLALTVVACAAALLASACGKQEALIAPAAPAHVANVASPVPDVGKMSNVSTSAQGFGSTAGEAVADAMKLAVLQVNGAAIQSSTVSAKYGLDVTLNQDSTSLRANGFAEVVAQRSGGAIQNFKLLELIAPTATSKHFKAKIEAHIAKFTPSADMQKMKIVVGQIRFESPTVVVGDRTVSSTELGSALRQRISDALVQTGRFAVLDRELSADIQGELDMISSGQSPSAELAKLSQAASADIVWSGKIQRLAYNKQVQHLRTSDRQLVSYSGGWAINERLVNVATRQVMGSSSLKGEAPSTAPTTLSQGVNSDKILADMSSDLAHQVVTSVLRRTFPVTVISRDGTNVVLSQGGRALKEGTRYAMVAMGAEMKDPQTGQSLGRIESQCCELVVERVTSNLSYGRLENVRSDLDQLQSGGLQMRDEVKQAIAQSSTAVTIAAAPQAALATTTTVTPAASVGAQTSKAAPRPAPRDASRPAEAASKTDDKW